MTTLFTVLAPAPGIDVDQFHDHWRHPHGTLGARLSAIRSYVQNHRIRPDGIPIAAGAAEGVVRVELHEGVSAAAIADDPIYRDHLSADETRFIDLDTIRPYVSTVTAQGPVTPRDCANGETSGGTDDLADREWSPFDDASAITLMRFTPEASTGDAAHRARSIGALWYATYQVEGDLPSGDPTRVIEQFWWPTVSRCRRYADTSSWSELADPDAGATVMLASCERLR